MSFSKYVIVVLLAFGVLAGFNQLYERSVRLSCWSGGYARDAWMAYCNSAHYGVYDVDATWFSSEPEVASAVANAQVLTLSDSHLQNALSLGGASEWFIDHHVRAYFLGLPVEESGFAEMLWAKFKPHPQVVIFDASPYFTGKLGSFENSILADAASRRTQAFELKDFQDFHRSFCAKHAWFCGHNFAYFRSRRDGHWIFPDPDPRIWVGKRSVPNDATEYPTGTIPDELAPLYPQYLEAARKLIVETHLPPRCIVITYVPSQDSGADLARFLASSLGVTLIVPDVPGLKTFDRSHLTPQSSRRWTQAFLAGLEPVLQSCATPR